LISTRMDLNEFSGVCLCLLRCQDFLLAGIATAASQELKCCCCLLSKNQVKRMFPKIMIFAAARKAATLRKMVFDW
jgi:hypothetical protein